MIWGGWVYISNAYKTCESKLYYPSKKPINVSNEKENGNNMSSIILCNEEF
jgi:hypothetical protein